MSQGFDPRPEWDPYRAPSYEPIAPPRRSVPNAALASRLARFVARVVDLSLFLVAGATAAAAIAFSVEGVTRWLMLTVIPVSFTAYQCYLVTTSGQSLAKKWMGLQIVRLDGAPVGFVHGVVLREWLVLVIGFIPFVGLLFRLADSVLIFGEDRRCVHDHFAGTMVVNREGR